MSDSAVQNVSTQDFEDLRISEIQVNRALRGFQITTSGGSLFVPTLRDLSFFVGVNVFG